MSTTSHGREVNVRFSVFVRASPLTVFRGSGRMFVLDVLIVCGINGSPTSFSEPVETYAVRRVRFANFTPTMPFTVRNVLLGASDARPWAGVLLASLTR